MALRVLVGSGRLLISKSGKQATSTVDDDFILNENRNLTQPLLYGTATTPSGGTTITHNLGYIPVCVVFGSQGSTYVRRYAYVTTSQLVLSGGLTLTYFIFGTQVA